MDKYSLVCKELQTKDKIIKKLKEVLNNYGYPCHEDGDRAYIFGLKARKVLKEVKLLEKKLSAL